MRKIFLLLSFYLILFVFSPSPVLAAAPAPSPIQGLGLPGCTLETFGTGGPLMHGIGVYTFGCLARIVQNVIVVALFFLGGVTILFLIVGAIRFALSFGNEKSVKGAKDMMTYAIIGVVVVILSFAIFRLFLSAFNLPDLIAKFAFFQ